MLDECTENKMLIPCLPLRDILVFPHINMPLFVGRKQSINALEAAMNADKHIVLATQKDPRIDDPALTELYEIGVFATILQLLKLPDGTVKILVEGKYRVKLTDLQSKNQYLFSEVIKVKDESEAADQVLMSATLLSLFKEYGQLSKKILLEEINQISEIHLESAGHDLFVDRIAASLSIPIKDKQKILSTINLNHRQKLVINILNSEINLMKIEKQVQKRIKKQVEKSQREYYLSEQVKAIQQELGQDSEMNEIDEIKAKIDKKRMPKDIKKKLNIEIKKLKSMPATSSESTVVRNYIDWILALPFYKKSGVKHDLLAAHNMLNQDHYGLLEAKERILEYLAVYQQTKMVSGSVLCLLGPPGVGKTSLCSSMATAMNRKLIRISLGGIHDESEIRGHRRTYVGSMPGRIMQKIAQVGVKNPIILLDEIDKISSNVRGDPYAALLEVLDLEQNSHFHDNYLEVEFDLSEVVFIATANSMDMPEPLLDRMEIIQIPGYTEAEKIQITQSFLIPKQFKRHAMPPTEIQFTSSILSTLIRKYTKEAGVRNLNREIEKICRKFIKNNMMNENKLKEIELNLTHLELYNGIPKYEANLIFKDKVGVINGLAWTSFGGEILSIEAALLSGKGKIIKTGSLGEVMQESIQISLSVVRSRAQAFNLNPNFLMDYDLHVHLPEGSTPKDGPSAGAAICVAIFSVLMNKMIKSNLAMTGEINLNGHLISVGGVKEKILAAHRHGIKTLIIPQGNSQSLKEIDEKIKASFDIYTLSTIEEVLDIALYPFPES